jgi:hypothetical protein
MAASPEGRREDPPPGTPRKTQSQLTVRQGEEANRAPWRTGGWRSILPAGHRSHCAGACGSPTRWPAWGDGAAVSCRRRGTTRPAVLSGRTPRRVGGLGSRPSPSDRSRSAGQKTRPPRSGKKRKALHPATVAPVRETSRSRSEKKQRSRDAGQEKPSAKRQMFQRTCPESGSTIREETSTASKSLPWI